MFFLSEMCPIIYSRFFSVLVMFCFFSGIKKIVQKLKNIYRHLHIKKLFSSLIMFEKDECLVE